MRLLTPAKASVLCFLYSLAAHGGTLSDSPLFLQSSTPPNVLFALSVEFPTAITAAYQGSNDYSKNNTYLGYFDSEKCYSYDSTNNWFYPVGMATSPHTCSNQWSGSFLNWATMTGLDEFRYAMTGGNRYQDTASLTVLERSYMSNQGSTSNFPNKTYSGTDATPYPAGSTLTIANWNKGTQMTVSLGGSGTANCTNPQISGSTFSCNLNLATTGEAGSCTTWSGNGTSASPYQCTAFGAFADSGTPSSATAGTKSSATSVTTDTVTCSNPAYAGSTFSCTLTNNSNTSGTCNTWSGTGTSNSPFTCASFGNFGASSFVASSTASATTFNSTQNVSQAADNVSSCSTLSSTQIVCSLDSGRTATCSNPSGNGKSSNPYNCTSSNSWTISGTPSATYVSNTNSSSTTTSGTKRYFVPTTITYSIPVSTTYYYIPSYGGSDSTSAYYYYSTYNINFGGSANYYVRAKVCDSSVGLENNCTQYGASSYKPTGVVQKNGETMRFGVFSYYNANDTDNAVMRSKLKYVAPLKWTSSGTSISNSIKEWSSTDGTLVTNPDSTEASASYGGAVSNSGVINYVNKFGSGSHSYKTYDNVGKLYYEALKYLRGSTPTTDFYTRAGSSNNDGFPVITSWDDPVINSCQKNFIIAMGDTHTWCDKRLPGGTYSSETSSCTSKGPTYQDQGSLGNGDSTVNVTTWTNRIGTLESKANLATTLTGAGSSASYYMSGLSYWAAKNGIRPKNDLTVHTPDNDPTKNITVKTYVIDVQEYGDLGVGSQYWYAAKYGGVDSFDANGNPLNWYTTNPQYNGNWPKALLPAGNPASMIAAVNSAIASIAAQTGSGADVGLSTGDLRTGNGTNLYSASYNSAGWSGDVSCYHMNSDLSINATPSWQASTYLNPSTLNSGGTKPWTTRRILTFNDGLNANGTANTALNGRQGVDFRVTDSNGSDIFSTNFSDRQQALLSIDPATGTDDGRGADRVDYLRGDNSNEGTNGFQWRTRTSSLGDFINSSPIYVRYPATSISDSTYNTYATQVASRTPMLYVGSNDGMLHAFDASEDASGNATANSGKEKLAYVPAAIYANLSKLTWPNYSHKYFVDATPTVADAQLTDSCDVNSDSTYKCWRTVLVGGLNAGGQGIYALNITNPTNFSSDAANSLVLWEFTDRDDADLGYTFAQPIVRKMNNGKWAVIFGNGFNNTVSDGKASTTGRAYLYILLLDGPGFDNNGRGRNWVLGTNYYKIELKSPSEGANATLPLNPPNGLSTVAGLDKTGDGTVDYLYAGDRSGNLWKIDVSNADPTNWAAAFGTTSNPKPLFTATTGDATPKQQQITTSPIITRHPSGGYLVLFGTGSYIDVSDLDTPYTMNSFYGIWDQDNGTAVPSGQNAKVLRSQLQKQATLATATSGVKTYSLQSDCQPQYSSSAQAPTAATSTCPSSLAPALDGNGKVAQQLGWVLDLNNTGGGSATGERYMSSIPPALDNTLLTFVTLTPGVACDATNAGYDFKYDIDATTGGAYSNAVYYTTGGGTMSALSLNFSVGQAAINNKYPSGMKLTTSIGQNPKKISYQTDSTGSPTTSACAHFVKGQPCIKKPMKCPIIDVAHGCQSSDAASNPGRISWRQIIQ